MTITKEHILKVLQENPQIAGSLQLKTSRYWPEGWTPTAKQRAFLMLPHEEAFYGGAAGGGKSEALLACALQYVDVPGYAAIIFRKTLSDLKLPSSLLSRAHEWLGWRSDCKYVASEHAYYFPTVDGRGRPAEPARLVFGYIGQEGVRHRYQSAEFQTICFDELTQHDQADFEYMFSRRRKRVCPKHRLKRGVDKEGNPIMEPNYVDGCWWCTVYKNLPLRTRSASNPGGVGHQWVKDRYGIREVVDENGNKRFIGTNPDRPYIPAFVYDNIYIDQESYIEGLNKLDPITREQLKKGDWSVSVDARFKKSWVRYYSIRGETYFLGRNGSGTPVKHFQRVFASVDPAGSAKEGPDDHKRYRYPSQHSWTVIMTFGLTADYHLLILDVRRFNAEIPEILDQLKDVMRRWRPQKFIVEGSGLGRGVYQLALKYGLPVEPVFPHADKLVRATDAMLRMEQGRIWLPEPPGPPWLEPLEAELFTWSAHPYETDDQVDALSYGAMDVSWEAAAAERNEVLGDAAVTPWDEQPEVIRLKAPFRRYSYFI